MDSKSATGKTRIGFGKYTKKYLASGADIISTVTYQASLERFRELGFDEFTALNFFKKSVALAKEAISKSKRKSDGLDFDLIVAGSLGPYGAYLADCSEYSGDYQIGKSKWKDFHKRRIEILIQSGSRLSCF